MIPSGQDPVSMFDPATWGMAFPELFPFGDGVPFLFRETKMSFLERSSICSCVMNWCMMSLGWMSIRHPIEQGGHRMFLGVALLN